MMTLFGVALTAANFTLAIVAVLNGSPLWLIFIASSAGTLAAICTIINARL